MEMIERLIADLDGHSCRDQFGVTRTEGPDLSAFDRKAMEYGLMSSPRDVAAGLLIETGDASLHLPFFTFEQHELVAAAEQVQDFLLEYFVVVWPDCPAHSDPLWPALISGEAMWACKYNKSMRRQIGALRS